MLPRLLLVGVALIVCVAPLKGQSAVDLVNGGVRAYQDLEFDAAASFLRRALAEDPSGQLPDSLRKQALSYLAAAEIFRGNNDSAEAVFERLVLLDVRYQPDPLVFPPEVTNVWDEVRRNTPAVTIAAPDSMEFRFGDGGFSASLYASSFHQVTAELQSPTGLVISSLYRGPLADSLQVNWDGRSRAGSLAGPGLKYIVVTSRDQGGTPVRTARLPIEFEVVRPDTLPIPPRPADSLLLPERRASQPGIESLLGGLLVGAAVVALPSALVSGSSVEGARLGIAVGAVVAGVAGFASRLPGEPLEQNISANEELLQGWRSRVEAVRSQNEAAKSDVRVRITTRPQETASSEDG